VRFSCGRGFGRQRVRDLRPWVGPWAPKGSRFQTVYDGQAKFAPQIKSKSIKNESPRMPLSIDFSSTLMGFGNQVGRENRAKIDQQPIENGIETMMSKNSASWRLRGQVRGTPGYPGNWVATQLSHPVCDTGADLGAPPGSSHR